MIRIDSLTQPTTGVTTPTPKDSHQSSFAALLAEQAAKTAETSKAVLEKDHESDIPLTAPDDTHQANPRDELLRLLSMSPAERIRYQMLQEMGLTEEALKQLPYEERMKIEEMIKEEIERQLGGGGKGSAEAQPGASV
ncbi:hypothetical protein GCM10009104_07510 [Marinobacterium maritimum]|uniref:Uncharacterized protein n=1 Tax=Marinobacterium maritimum TaxID=500162 RepID=A0ABN1I2Y7_9GAMM